MAVQGFGALTKRMQALRAAAGIVAITTAPLIKADMVKLETRKFDREGPRWKQLADSTQADRIRNGYPGAHPILNREGDLRHRLTDGLTVRFETDAIFVGTQDDEIAGWHQQGTEKMPARPVVVITPATGERWARYVARNLRGRA